MRIPQLILLALPLVSPHAATKHKPLFFSTTGIEGHAIPRWPKTADTIHVTNCEEGLGSTPTRTGLLGLMATGEQKHLEVVAEIIRNSDMLKVDPEVIDEYLKTGQPNLGSTGWTWGYNLIALGEYYLLTKDESVLPAIRTYALGLARGQDAVGLWGHRMATEARRGRAPGYGIMNQCSLSNFMGMLLARKCGIQDPVLDQAIETTNAYVADRFTPAWQKAVEKIREDHHPRKLITAEEAMQTGR